MSHVCMTTWDMQSLRGKLKPKMAVTLIELRGMQQLEDKVKYEAAQDQLGGAKASASQALSDLDMIKLVQREKLNTLKSSYAGMPYVYLCMDTYTDYEAAAEAIGQKSSNTCTAISKKHSSRHACTFSAKSKLTYAFLKLTLVFNYSGPSSRLRLSLN